MHDAPAVIAELLERCRRDHHAWINGDGSGYALPDDGVIMGAFGGTGRGGLATSERQQAVARMWTWGDGSVELVDGGVSGDLAWLAMVERASVRFEGAAAAGPWNLRVTELFRWNGSTWERFHRHADPLVGVHGRRDLAPLLGDA